MTTTLRWTDELLAWLDERELRYEVIDGSVVVTPPAGFGHEDVAGALFAALRSAAPPDLVVLGPNYGFYYAGSSFVLPDVLVARRSDCEDDGIRTAPVLVVEVASPGTRRRDRGEKLAIYAEAGVEHYWLVDPDRLVVRLLELRDGSYAETATAVGRLATDVPFPVEVDLPRRRP